MTVATDNPIAMILGSVPELRALTNARKNQANEFLERRLGLLAGNINSSPYEPYWRRDELHLNTDFPGALYRWIDQFPDEHKLGFLTIALSTVYVTKEEMDLMLDIACQRLQETLDDWEGVEFDASLGLSRTNIVPLPVSEFAESSAFSHRMGLAGMRDRSTRPHRSVDEFLQSTINSLRMVADNVSIYDEENTRALKQVTDSLLNHHIVLLEDCSFSGTRITRTRDRFLDLMDVLFSPYESVLRAKGHTCPTVSLLIICGTSASLASLNKPHSSPTRHAPVFGAVFDEGNRAVDVLPDNTREFCVLLGAEQATVHAKLARAVDWFWDECGHIYVDTTAVASTAQFDVGELRWGYGGNKAGGWSVVTHHNCPNNSLMPLWCPPAGSPGSTRKALFGRVESHVDHSEPARRFDVAIHSVRSDSKKLLSRALSATYNNLPEC